MKNLLSLTIFVILITTQIYAQQTTRKPLNLWNFFLSRQTYSEKLSSTLELHERTEGFFNKQQNILIRPSLDYHFNKNIEISAGYTFINGYLNKEFNKRHEQIENNLWEQIFIKHAISHTSLYLRLRLENRWVEDFNTHADSTLQTVNFYPSNTQYRNRFRYRFGGVYKPHIFNNKNWFLSVFDEIWINASNKLEYSSLGRNWLYLGFGYELNKTSNIQLGYMKQRDLSNMFVNTNFIQLSAVKNFNI